MKSIPWTSQQEWIWEAWKMSHSAKIRPPRLIVAHFVTECQTKSALQRVCCLTRVSEDHMPFKKCAPKVWENNDGVKRGHFATFKQKNTETCRQWGRMCRTDCQRSRLSSTKRILSCVWKYRKWHHPGLCQPEISQCNHPQIGDNNLLTFWSNFCL